MTFFRRDMFVPFCLKTSELILKDLRLSFLSAQSVPFRITFVSDTFEATGTGAEYDTANTVTSNNEGFKIAYTQS